MKVFSPSQVVGGPAHARWGEERTVELSSQSLLACCSQLFLGSRPDNLSLPSHHVNTVTARRTQQLTSHH